MKPDGEQGEKVMERVTAVRRFEVAFTYSLEVCKRCTNDANSYAGALNPSNLRSDYIWRLGLYNSD